MSKLLICLALVAICIAMTTGKPGGGRGGRGDRGDRGGRGDRGDRGDLGDRGDRGDRGHHKGPKSLVRIYEGLNGGGAPEFGIQ